MNTKIWIPLLAAIASAGLSSTTPVEAQQAVTFFVSSAGKGNGADLGGLAGADAHCQALARAAGSTLTNWHAYLSTTEPGGTEGVNARDRIGKGPWQKQKAWLWRKAWKTPLRVKQHHQADWFTRKGETVPAATTGSTPMTFSRALTRRECFRPPAATRPAATGQKARGPRDRRSSRSSGSQGYAAHESWNSSHGSRGCSQDALKASGGAGLLYCFAAN